MHATSHACLRCAPAGSTRLTAPHAQLSRSLANARSLAGSRPHPAMRWPAAANAPGLGPLGRWGGALPRPFGQGPLPPPPGLPARLLSSLGPPRPAVPLSPLRGVPSGPPRPVPGAPSGARCCAASAGRVGPGRRGPGGCAPAPRRPLHGSCPPRRLRFAPSGYNQALGGGLCPRPRYARGSLRYAQTKPSPSRWAARAWFLFRFCPHCRSISSSLGLVFPRYRAFYYLVAALMLPCGQTRRGAWSGGAPFPRLSPPAGPQFPASVPPLATLAPCGLRGERSRHGRRGVFFGYARPRQLRPACIAGMWSGSAGVSLICPSGKRAGRRPDAGAKRGAPLHAGLFWQTCGARRHGDARGAGLASPRRAGWGRAKPAVARFLRASLIQPAPRGAGSPCKAPRATPCPLIAPRRSASPVLRSAPRFFLPPRQSDAPNRPHARWARDAPAPPLHCVALRAPRPQFPWPAAHCPPLSSPPLFKLRRRRCGGPPLVEQFETFGWRQQRRKPTRGKEEREATQTRRNFFFNSIFQKQR